MDRLSYVLTLAVGPVVIGGLIIAVLTLGLDSASWIVGAIVVGALLTYPASLLISRYIKRRDAKWNAKLKSPSDLIPHPNKPEI